MKRILKGAFNGKMTLKEQQLFKKIRRGDIHSFERLFHQYYPGLCGYAQSLVHKGEIAEEVVQDVFYNVVEKQRIASHSQELAELSVPLRL